MKSALVRSGPNNFDAIRISMALLVVWSHSFALYFGSESREPVSLLMAGVLNAGNLGVDVFFIVSGFLITQSFARTRSHAQFLRKRVARIYPGFLVAITICAFVILPLYAHTVYGAGAIVETFGLNLLLQGWFVNGDPFVHNPVQALNGALWSIPFEFWCYLGVLATGVLGVLKRRVWLLGAFALVVAIHTALDATGRKPGLGIIGVIFGWPYLWSRMLPYFMAGMLVYLYRELIPRSWLGASCGIALLVLAAHLSPLSCDVLLPIVITYAMFHLAFARSTVRAARYGDFSYGTYLYAFPIQQLLVASKVFSFPLYVVASALLSLAAGVISWHGVEKWFHSHNPRVPQTDAARAAPG